VRLFSWKAELLSIDAVVVDLTVLVACLQLWVVGLVLFAVRSGYRTSASADARLLLCLL